MTATYDDLSNYMTAICAKGPKVELVKKRQPIPAPGFDLDLLFASSEAAETITDHINLWKDKGGDMYKDNRALIDLSNTELTTLSTMMNDELKRRTEAVVNANVNVESRKRMINYAKSRCDNLISIALAGTLARSQEELKRPSS